MLVRKFGVAANRRNGDAVKTGSGGRPCLKAPIAVPVFGEQRRGFVGAALDRDDVAAARNRCDEGIVAEAAEILGEPLQIVVTQRLAGKGEDMMVEPRRADVGHDVGRKRLRQVDAGDRGAARLAAGGDRESHGAMLRRSPAAVNRCAKPVRHRSARRRGSSRRSRARSSPGSRTASSRSGAGRQGPSASRSGNRAGSVPPYGLPR